MTKKLLQDLNGLTDEKRIHKIVSERLSAFGMVVSLKVFDLPAHESRIILITMDSQQASVAAINSLGVVSFGERSLLINLPNRRD
ncbi:MAG: hypothetical protein M0P59_10885 [Gallionella sp.]|jgi:hypothetical protein|nr:hypothetical protein [Gallionella sp.]MCK9354653.1 hypothetical protein [Gallionella sp.]